MKTLQYLDGCSLVERAHGLSVLQECLDILVVCCKVQIGISFSYVQV